MHSPTFGSSSLDKFIIGYLYRKRTLTWKQTQKGPNQPQLLIIIKKTTQSPQNLESTTTHFYLIWKTNCKCKVPCILKMHEKLYWRKYSICSTQNYFHVLISGLLLCSVLFDCVPLTASTKYTEWHLLRISKLKWELHCNTNLTFKQRFIPRQIPDYIWTPPLQVFGILSAH